ncbi:FAD dependent oxidoreductase [Fusarium albosuccineum]|uniref:sarcosine oxidasee (formaldehyde-forming) n=1 Tax=Fusarium albosuccineum TaxID=1237068 RepID=A0A8H4LCF9_9HYPO|nr:FAD dependent oxidoreductase [Fusarium albosuccineum]
MPGRATPEFDVAVIGLGALGSAAAYQAAIKGSKVVGFEQFELGHVRGASHDTSRIVRTSYGPPEYVALARSAYKDWAELERRTGQTLLTITGGVVLLPRDSPHSVNDYARSLDVNGVSYELLTPTEVNRRWPQFNISDNVDTVYTADSGIVHASRSVVAMQYLARAHGAVLKERTEVTRLMPRDDGGVVVETSDGRFFVSKVILATDAWANKLLEPLNATVPLSVMQEQVTYFKPDDATLFEPSRFPVWIWGEKEWYYGFPSYGEPTIKAGRDVSNNFMAPEQRTYVHSPELLEQLSTFVGNLIPTKGQALRTITCQYAITPDRQFILSPLKQHQDIILGLGAGHGFKFAPAIGRVLAELAMEEKQVRIYQSLGSPRRRAAGECREAAVPGCCV